MSTIDDKFQEDLYSTILDGISITIEKYNGYIDDKDALISTLREISDYVINTIAENEVI